MIQWRAKHRQKVKFMRLLVFTIVLSVLTFLCLRCVSSIASKDIQDNILHSKKKDTKQTQKVLAYSLFGKQQNWWEAMVVTARQVPTFYPDWEIRIYHDEHVPNETLMEIGQLHQVRLIHVPLELPFAAHWNPKTWRFLVASDPSVILYGLRDVDSRPTIRERAAVDEFIMAHAAPATNTASRIHFHLMRDHPGHDPRHFAALLAGMWDARHEAVPQMKQLLQEYYGNNTKDKNNKKKTPVEEFPYTDDQDFLWKHVLPLARNNCLQHDSYYCIETGGIAFPLTREEVHAPFDYVGNVFNRYAHFEGKFDDPRLTDPEAVERYNTCLELRRHAMLKLKKRKNNNDSKGAEVLLLPDTSYKGRSDLSSSQLMAEAKAKT